MAHITQYRVIMAMRRYAEASPAPNPRRLLVPNALRRSVGNGLPRRGARRTDTGIVQLENESTTQSVTHEQAPPQRRQRAAGRLPHVCV